MVDVQTPPEAVFELGGEEEPAASDANGAQEAEPVEATVSSTSGDASVVSTEEEPTEGPKASAEPLPAEGPTQVSSGAKTVAIDTIESEAGSSPKPPPTPNVTPTASSGTPTKTISVSKLEGNLSRFAEEITEEPAKPYEEPPPPYPSDDESLETLRPHGRVPSMLEKMDEGLGKLEDAFSRLGDVMKRKASSMRKAAQERKQGREAKEVKQERPSTWQQRLRFGRGTNEKSASTFSSLKSRVFGYEADTADPNSETNPIGLSARKERSKVSSREVLPWLGKAKGDPSIAQDMVKQSKMLRQEHMRTMQESPQRHENVKALLAAGAAYWYGADLAGRPVLHLCLPAFSREALLSASGGMPGKTARASDTTEEAQGGVPNDGQPETQAMGSGEAGSEQNLEKNSGLDPPEEEDPCGDSTKPSKPGIESHAVRAASDLLEHILWLAEERDVFKCKNAEATAQGDPDSSPSEFVVLVDVMGQQDGESHALLDAFPHFVAYVSRAVSYTIAKVLIAPKDTLNSSQEEAWLEQVVYGSSPKLPDDCVQFLHPNELPYCLPRDYLPVNLGGTAFCRPSGYTSGIASDVEVKAAGKISGRSQDTANAEEPDAIRDSNQADDFEKQLGELVEGNSEGVFSIA